MSDAKIFTALWATSPGQAELRSQPLSPPADGQVQVRMRRSAISRGTESLVLHGKVPASEHDRMRGPHQDGRFPFPVKYGYMAVGIVEAGD